MKNDTAVFGADSFGFTYSQTVGIIKKFTMNKLLGVCLMCLIGVSCVVDAIGRSGPDLKMENGADT
ncbi:MAG: hypothetical protein K2I52_08540, partial [Muribaculaceae bacterium]|nr:hypothetical protein [Muribaculaceae bacterium]